MEDKERRELISNMLTAVGLARASAEAPAGIGGEFGGVPGALAYWEECNGRPESALAIREWIGEQDRLRKLKFNPDKHRNSTHG